MVLAASVVVALASGCVFDSSEDHETPQGKPPPEYVTPDTPENALINFRVALVTRDLEGYAGVLASDFVYQFPTDLPVEQMGTCDGEWTRAEELAAAETMFDSPDVLEIVFDLPEVEATSSTEIGLPGDAMRIRLVGTEFIVHEDDGTSYVTRSSVVYDLFFRPGRAEAAEDPGAWYLFLWRELPPPNAPGPRLTGAPTPVRAITWWEIKCDWGA